MSQFVKNVTAFVDALGYEYPGVILSLANIPWESDQDRNDFIKNLIREV
jgi:hypothetical protein